MALVGRVAGEGCSLKLDFYVVQSTPQSSLITTSALTSDSNIPR